MRTFVRTNHKVAAVYLRRMQQLIGMKEGEPEKNKERPGRTVRSCGLRVN